MHYVDFAPSIISHNDIKREVYVCLGPPKNSRVAPRRVFVHTCCGTVAFELLGMSITGVVSGRLHIE